MNYDIKNISPMVTTKQIYSRYTKDKQKKFIYTITENHPITMLENKRGRKEKINYVSA